MGVSTIARQHIVEDVQQQRANFRDNLLDYEKHYGNYDSWDEWFVGASRLFTKESSRLNRALGIHKVNMKGGK